MIIAPISGKAQHGKDSTATILKQKLEARNKKVLIVHYADYLKYMCKQYFGWNGIKDETGRTILQQIGTNIIRQRNPDFWVEIVSKLTDVFEQEYDYVLIPDARFPNEIDYHKKHARKVIALRVIRKNFESQLTDEQKNHISEIALDNYPFDYYIVSESGLDRLETEVEKLDQYLQQKED